MPNNMTPEIRALGSEAHSQNARKREEQFCQEYVTNGYDYLAAYRTVFGCTNDSTVRSGANRMMKRPTVKARIRELQKEHFEMLSINAERIAEKLAEMAFADKDDEVYGPSVALKALDLLQKQLGLQKQKIDANVDQTTTLNVTIEED